MFGFVAAAGSHLTLVQSRLLAASEHSSEYYDVEMEVLLSGWRDFYLAAGSAAAVLLGLIFLGMSLHLQTGGSHRDRAVVRPAAQTALLFIYVVVISLLMLIPPRPPVVPFLLVLLVTVIGLLDSVANCAEALRRRQGMLNAGLVLMIFAGLVAGASILLFMVRLGLYVLSTLVTLLIGVGTRNAWFIVLRPRAGGDT